MNARSLIIVICCFFSGSAYSFQSGQARGLGTQGVGAADEFLKFPKQGLGQTAKKTRRERHRRYYEYHDSSLVQNRRKAADKKLESGRTISTMEFDQLRNEKNNYLANGNYFSAQKFLERMIKMCDDMQELANLMIEYGDTLHELGQVRKAEKLYTEFARLYPGHIKAEYAQYRAILCASSTILSPDRDQQATKRTIELADTFLERSAIYTTYKADVEKIRSSCYQTLVDHEFVVCEFYLLNDRFKPLGRRLEYVRNELLPEHPKAEFQLLAWEQKTVGRQQEKEELKDQPFYTPILRTVFGADEPTVSRRRRHGYYANQTT